MRRPHPPALGLLTVFLAACASSSPDRSDVVVEEPAAPTGWPTWRGTEQRGASLETGLVESWTPGGENHLWTYEASGRGSPVIFEDRVFGMGYKGEAGDLREVAYCLDARDGSVIWERYYTDFISDVVYDRYAIASPVVDVETGNVIYVTAPGLMVCVTRDGEPVWDHSLMEEFGRLTFPNGRTGALVVDGDLAIFHMISSHWGPEGPARDRVYAFDKNTGEHVWTCTPGEAPKDNSMANPTLDWVNGRRVMYFGTGCGNLVCVDARTGEALWRYKMSIGGLNSAALLHGDSVIAIHGRENVDSSVIGRMVAVRAGAEPAEGEAGPVLLGSEYELWRNELAAFSSSPVMAEGRVYVTTQHGELACVDPDTGEIVWREKLAADQIHASPLWADGKLYVPWNEGTFHIVRPGPDGPEVLETVDLEGACLGAPVVSEGRIFVHTTKALYCFGAPGPGAALAAREPGPPDGGAAGAAAALQVVPGDILVRPGDTVRFHARSLDALGATVEADVGGVTWTPGPTLDLDFAADGTMTVPADARSAAGVVKAAAGGLDGSSRVRIVPVMDYAMDFESFELDQGGGTFAWPPSFWIGGRPKWDVREIDGTKALAKTLTVALFQRAITFFGNPDASNYTMQIDYRTDGNRRILSTAGVIHQRYLILLKGNYREIEVSSNMERLKQTVPFTIKPDTWYTLKTRVDVHPDGSGTIRAKAWVRGEPEPDAWTIEVEHQNAHTHGAPGLWGFAPQSRFRVFVDNISVTSND